jgi:hypothetical protein
MGAIVVLSKTYTAKVSKRVERFEGWERSADPQNGVAEDSKAQPAKITKQL